jgi:hypothetical protein
MIEIGPPADRVQETQVGHGERLPWWRSRGGAAGIWVDECSDLPIRRKPRSQPDGRSSSLLSVVALGATERAAVRQSQMALFLTS